MILPQEFIVFPDEKGEVAMVVLPLLVQAKAGLCSHKDFVEIIHFCEYNSQKFILK